MNPEKLERRATMNSSSIILPGTTPRFSEADSTVSGFSFKQWHKRMQQSHVQNKRVDFTLWKWCDKGCMPCRWFDNVDYDIKICKCCMKFRTFKSLVTVILLIGFMYGLLYGQLKAELLPGGTVFFMFMLFVTAYVAGLLLMFAGLPLMFGNLLVGIMFGNLPEEWLPDYNQSLLTRVTEILEKFLLIIAIIRAGLLLDMSRIKGRVTFIVRMSLFPLICEFALVWVSSRFLLGLPWGWAALQGSVLCIVSLSSVTSIMEKNRESGYGEDKHLATVLIAASAIDVVVGIFSYIICISYLFPSAGKGQNSFWNLISKIATESAVGLSSGFVVGLLIAFFPDKRNPEAAVLRIAILGLGSLSLASVLSLFSMGAAGVLGALTLCLVARNMWEETGWHEDSNPVQYFYSMVHYFGQPVALALVGFSIKFSKTNAEQVSMSMATIIVGIVGRELVCFASTLGRMYPTTMKEKIFICIAWFSKGTFQALLALAVTFMVEESENILPKHTFEEYEEYSKLVKHTTILAILLTTPLATYTLNILTPVLLTKTEHEHNPVEQEESRT